jgi:hypothetical protein
MDESEILGKRCFPWKVSQYQCKCFFIGHFLELQYFLAGTLAIRSLRAIIRNHNPTFYFWSEGKCLIFYFLFFF